GGGPALVPRPPGPAGGVPGPLPRRAGGPAAAVRAGHRLLPRHPGGPDQHPAARQGPQRLGGRAPRRRRAAPDRPRRRHRLRRGAGRGGGGARRPPRPGGHARARRPPGRPPGHRIHARQRFRHPRPLPAAGRGERGRRRRREECVTKPIRLLLADDHTLVRAGMRTLLGTLPDVEIVAEARDGKEALRLIEQHRPDVVLMDITMPELNGLEATARVAKDFPQSRVIILSMHASEEYVLQALKAGAAGYLLKEADIAELEL